MLIPKHDCYRMHAIYIVIKSVRIFMVIATNRLLFQPNIFTFVCLTCPGLDFKSTILPGRGKKYLSCMREI